MSTHDQASSIIDVAPTDLEKLVQAGHIRRNDKNDYSTQILIHDYVRYLRRVIEQQDLQPKQLDIAAHLDISDRRVRELANQWGIDSRSITLSEWRTRYIRELREQAAGRAAAGDLDLAGERARLASAQADRVEMINAKERRELAPLALIEEVLSKVGSRVARILDTLPSTIRRREPGLSAETIAAIGADIAKARNAAAAISLSDLQKNDESSESTDLQIDADIDVDEDA